MQKIYFFQLLILIIITSEYKLIKMRQKKQKQAPSLLREDKAVVLPTIKEWYFYIGIFLFSFILYSNTFQHQWALDDGVVFSENVHVKQGIKGYVDILTTHSMHGIKIKPEAYQYRPLSLLIFATEWQISPDNPQLYHILNVLWYALTSLMLFIVLRKIFIDKNRLLPLIITLLFIAHPVHTEVVANIKGRDDILLLLFVLLSLWFSFQYIDKQKKVALLGVFLSFLFAMFSKESAITFLVAIPLTIYFFRNANKQQYFYLTFAILLPIVIYLIVRFAVLSDYPTSHVTTMQNYLAGESLLTRWATAIMLLGKYLLMLVIPYQQVCDYSFNQLPLVNFLNWKTLVSLVIYFALIVYAIKTISKKNPIAYAIFFFIVTMSIYSNLIYLIGASFAERFLFIPSLSYCIALGYLLYHFSGFEHNHTKIDNKQRIGISSAIMIVVLLFFTVKTYSRSAEWENNFVLYGADIKKSPESARMNFFWGEALRDKANEYQDKNSNASSNEEFEINNLFYRAYLWESILAIQKGIQIFPRHANAYERLGYAFYSLSPYYRNKGFLDSAEYYYLQSLAINPYSLTANYNIAIVYYAKSDYDKAKNHYLKVVNIDASEQVVCFDVGSSYAMMGLMDSARHYFHLYLQNYPDNIISCYSNLAIGYARINELDSALTMCDNVLNIDKNNTSTYQLKIQIYAYMQDYEKAMEVAESLIEFQPEISVGYIEKANLLNQLNKKDSADFYYNIGQSKNR